MVGIGLGEIRVATVETDVPIVALQTYGDLRRLIARCPMLKSILNKRDEEQRSHLYRSIDVRREIYLYGSLGRTSKLHHLDVASHELYLTN